MNADFFFKFTKFKFGSLVNAEDFADKINYQWTGSMLIISTAIIAMRQYIFTPIQCWVPPEWPRPWEEYTENYCWIQNTYKVPYKGNTFPTKEMRTYEELNYYQWVPFMLALEAMLVYVPHMMWKIITVRSGYNPNAIVKFAADAATVDQTRKEKLISHLAQQITKAMNSRRKWKSKSICNSSWLRSWLPCFWFGKRSGSMLFSLYITNKIMYVLIAVGHLFLMQKFLGFDSVLFGWYCFQNLLNNKQWEETNIFPRVTFCDIPAKVVGGWNIRSVQCVLPVNLLNEKIYIFLWFWTIICLVLTCTSTVMWMVRLLYQKNRQNFIKKYLRILKVFAKDEDKEERDQRFKFVDTFLEFDGIFLLQMISENVGDLCTADVVKSMYDLYVSKTDEEQPVPIQNGQVNNRRVSVSSQRRRPSAMTVTESDSFFGKKSDV